MLSLILPTFNEAENIPELVPKVRDMLSAIPHEIIIVDDDSPDETWKVGLELFKDMDDVHVIRRIGRRGLSSAVIEGFLAAKGDVLAVMDADGQHDMSLLVTLYEATKEHGGIALGSRYMEGGSMGEWDERRQWMSRFATQLATAVCRVKVQDPMSGFFAIDRELFQNTVESLNPKGFKILLDLLVCVPKTTTVTEHPFTFALRLHGESKLSRRVQLEFAEYLYDVTVGRYIPLTFVKYCIVGTLGVGVHLGTYVSLSHLLSQGGELNFAGFSVAVLVSIEVAIVFNFWLNNLWTFAAQKLTGFQAFVGFLTFNFACLFGALANYAVSAYLFSIGWVELAAVALGALTGVFWNYTMNKVFTWRA